MSRSWRATILGAGVIASFALAACNIVGPAAFILQGPATAEAEYLLPDVPTVVFIDDRRNLLERAGTINPRQIRQRIAQKASEDLMVNEILTTTISSRDATAIAMRRDRNGKLLATDEIGRAVGAEIIIYVEIVAFRSSPDGATPRPSAACNVRVLDVVGRERLFPGPESEVGSRLVEVIMPTLSTELYRSRTGMVKVYELLADEIGRSVARLFYEHEIRELGGNLGSQ